MEEMQFTIYAEKSMLYLINSNHFYESLQAAQELSQHKLTPLQKKKIIVDFISKKNCITEEKSENILKILNTLKLNEPILSFICYFSKYRNDYVKLRPYLAQLPTLDFKKYECQFILNELSVIALLNHDITLLNQIDKKIKE